MSLLARCRQPGVVSNSDGCLPFVSRCWASTVILSDPLIGPHRDTIPPATLSAVTAAHQLHPDDELILMAVSGKRSSSNATTTTMIPRGITKLIHVRVPTSSDNNNHNVVSPENVAAAVHQVVTEEQAAGHECHAVLGASTKFGATVLPRVGALLRASPITDIIQIVNAGTYDSQTALTIV
jgi:electron transfer flavoprotein alpha subunit